jgi:hypothetical protein
MNTFENTYKEPVLIVRNIFDIQEDNDSLDVIANKLNQNLKVFRNNNLLREIVINNHSEGIIFNFHNYEESEIEHKVLVHGDEAFLFHEEHIYIHLPFELDYDSLLTMHNTDKLSDDTYFKLLFQKVKDLGSNEIHITVFDPGNMEMLIDRNWSEIEQALQSKEEYFKIVF